MSKRAFLAFAFLFTILIASGTSAQELIWEKTYVSSAVSSSDRSVQQTSDGGYIKVGTTNVPTLNDQVYLLKTFPNGVKEWEETYGGTGFDGGKAVQQTSDLGYIIAGVSGSEAYLIKVKSNGLKEWDFTFNFIPSFISTAYAVIQVSDGYIIAGTTGPSSVDLDVYLFKTDLSGNLLWKKSIGDTVTDVGSSVIQVSDGYIIAGTTGSVGNLEAYLLKTDLSGNLLWEKNFNYLLSPFNRALSVQQTFDGGFIMVGTTNDPILNNEVYLIKTTSSGNLVWEETYGGIGSDSGESVQQTFGGGYIIAGTTFSFGNGRQLYLLKTDIAGNLLWENDFGGPGLESATSVQQTSDGGYIVAGASGPFGDEDIYLLKVKQNNKISIAALCNAVKVKTDNCGYKRLEFGQQGNVNLGAPGSNTCDVTCQQPFLLSSSRWLNILRGRTTTASVLNPVTLESCGRNLGGVDQFDYSSQSPSNFFPSENNCWFKPPLSFLRDTWTGFEFFQNPITGVDCEVQNVGALRECGARNVDTTGFEIRLFENFNKVETEWPIWYAEGFASSIVSQASPTSVPADGVTESMITATTPSDPGEMTIFFTTTLGKFKSGTQSTSCTTIPGPPGTGTRTCNVFLKSSTDRVATITAKNIFLFSEGETYVTFTPVGRLKLLISAQPSVDIPATGTDYSNITITLPDIGNVFSVLITVETSLGSFVGANNLKKTTCQTSGPDGFPESCTVKLISSTAGTADVFASAGGLGAPYDDSDTIQVVFIDTNIISLEAKPNPAPANGVTESTITATLGGNAPDLIISFTKTGLPESTFDTPTCTTDDNGKCSVKIKSTKIGTATVTATTTGYTSGTVNVVFIDVKNIFLEAKPISVPANGFSESTITATLGDLVSLVTISFTKTGLAGSTFDTSECTTGANGKCSVKLKSTEIGTAIVTASANGYNDGTVNVEFTSPDVFCTLFTGQQVLVGTCFIDEDIDGDGVGDYAGSDPIGQLWSCVADDTLQEASCSTTCARDLTGLFSGDMRDLCAAQTPHICDDTNNGFPAYCSCGNGACETWESGDGTCSVDCVGRQDCTVPGLIPADSCKAVEVSGDTFVYWCDGATGTATAGCALCDGNGGTSELLCRNEGFNVCRDQTSKGDGLCVSFTPASECEGLGKTECLNKACVWEETPDPDLCRACNYFTQCWTYDNLETCGANPCGIFYWDGNEGSCDWKPLRSPSCVFKVDDPVAAGGIEEYVGGVDWSECVGGRRTGQQTVIRDGTQQTATVIQTCPSIIPLVFLTKQTAIMIILLLVAYYFYALGKNKSGKSTKSRRKRRK